MVRLMLIWLSVVVLIVCAVYIVPTVRFIVKRAKFTVKLRAALKKTGSRMRKTGASFGRRTSFYIETEDTLYSVVLFRCFYKTMLYFDKRGTMQVRRMGARRLLPFKAWYNVATGDFDFRYGFDKLPTECRLKRLVRVLLLNPAAKSVTVASRYGEAFTDSGEEIDSFVILSGSYFIEQLR